jgi:hypothetical protein
VHCPALLAKVLEVDVGMAVAGSDQGEAADLVGGEAGVFDQPRGQGVVRRGQLKEFLALEQPPPRKAGAANRRNIEVRSVQSLCLRPERP